MWSFSALVSWGTSYFKSFKTLSTEEIITEDILIQELGGGGTIPCKQLYQKAEDQGISKKVLWSAAKRLNVKLDKGGFKDGWLWQLPLEISPEDAFQNIFRRFLKIPFTEW